MFLTLIRKVCHSDIKKVFQSMIDWVIFSKESLHILYVTSRCHILLPEKIFFLTSQLIIYCFIFSELQIGRSRNSIKMQMHRTNNLFLPVFLAFLLEISLYLPSWTSRLLRWFFLLFHHLFGKLISLENEEGVNLLFWKELFAYYSAKLTRQDLRKKPRLFYVYLLPAFSDF